MEMIYEIQNYLYGTVVLFANKLHYLPQVTEGARDPI